MKSSLKMITLIAAALMLQACAKDKNADDYKKDYAQKVLAQYKAVEGRYTGLITDSKTKQILGGFEIDLTAETRTTNPTDGSAAVPTAVLKSQVLFVDDNSFTRVTDKSSYDPNTGSYGSDFTLSGAPADAANSGNSGTSATNAVTFSVNGNIYGTHITGHLSGGQNAKGADFELVKDGPAVEVLAQQRNKASTDNDVHSFYSDQVVDPVIGKVRILAQLSYTDSENPDIHFQNVFLNNKKIFEFQWILDPKGGNVPAVFESASWDILNSTITGTATISTPTYPVVEKIVCHGFYSFTQSKPFECDFSSSRTQRIHSVFQPCPGNQCQ